MALPLSFSKMNACKRVRIIKVCIYVTVMFLTLSAAAILFFDRWKTDARAMNGDLWHEDQLFTACRDYAREHKGKFPGKLEDLVPDYFKEDEFKRLKYFDPEINVFGGDKMNKEMGTWLYFPESGGKRSGISVNPVIIASPLYRESLWSEKRVIMRADNSGSFVDEHEFRRILQEQNESLPPLRGVPAVP